MLSSELSSCHRGSNIKNLQQHCCREHTVREVLIVSIIGPDRNRRLERQRSKSHIVFWKTRRAARPATTESNTLLSAATLSMFFELTLDLLLRNPFGVELVRDLAGPGEIELAANLQRDALRVAGRVEHGRTLAPAERSSADRPAASRRYGAGVMQLTKCGSTVI